MRRMTSQVATLAFAALVLAAPGLQAQVCDDVSDECRTTAVADCTDADGESVTVQLGGLGAEDGDDNGGTCGGAPATALVTFLKVSNTELEVTVNNASCEDTSLTAAFWNMTATVASMTLDSVVPVAPDVVNTTWFGEYSQTTASNDGFGFRGDGFGNFDVNVHNGNLNPNGGDPTEILAGETLVFTFTDVEPGFDLCDILSEISTPPPGEMNRNVVGRFQSCDTATVYQCKDGDTPGAVCVLDSDCPGFDDLVDPAVCNLTDSAYIGPCTPDDGLLAVIRDFTLTPGDGKMTADWETSLEVNNAGFNVLRREARSGGGWSYVNVDFIPGQGDSVSGARYRFEDATALNGVDYQYRIEDVEFGGKKSLNGIRREITNPQNPSVKLQSPAYGEAVRFERGLKIGYRGVGLVRGTVELEFSADAAFDPASTVSARLHVRGGDNEFRLSPNLLRRLEAISGDGTLYWRLAGASDTFLMEVE